MCPQYTDVLEHFRQYVSELYDELLLTHPSLIHRMRVRKEYLRRVSFSAQQLRMRNKDTMWNKAGSKRMPQQVTCGHPRRCGEAAAT